jgi:biotin carboxyl carrier protein
MKNYKFKINGNLYEVDILEAEGNKVKIEVNGTSYDVELEREVPKVRTAVRPATVLSKQDRDAKPLSGAGDGKSTEIKAPLPGVIIKLLVKTGEEVTPGQTLCTLETMKMENAIKSEAGGKVTAVNIAAGQSVLQDEVLIVIG